MNHSSNRKPNNYTDQSSPNAQNMRSDDPNMPLISNNAKVDLSDDPLSGLDEQNDTGSCTGAEFGGYGRYSNGYTQNPNPVQAANSIHTSENSNKVSPKKNTSKDNDRHRRAGFYLAVAISAVALGAAVWSGTELPIRNTDNSSSETVQSENTPVTASKDDIPKTENFVLDYSSASDSDSNNTIMEEALPSDTVTAETDTEFSSDEELQTAESSSSDATAVITPNVQTPSTPEHFTLPIEGGIVTQPFSKGELVKSKTLGEWRTHDGTDFAAAEGTPILSIADGKVEAVEKNARWGNTVTVNYGDYTAYYYALGEPVYVQPGETVTAGQKLAAAGNSSLVESEEVPHFHLAVQKDGNWIDPALLLGIDESDESPDESAAENTDTNRSN